MPMLSCSVYSQFHHLEFQAQRTMHLAIFTLTKPPPSFCKWSNLDRSRRYGPLTKLGCSLNRLYVFDWPSFQPWATETSKYPRIGSVHKAVSISRCHRRF